MADRDDNAAPAKEGAGKAPAKSDDEGAGPKEGKKGDDAGKATPAPAPGSAVEGKGAAPAAIGEKPQAGPRAPAETPADRTKVGEPAGRDRRRPEGRPRGPPRRDDRRDNLESWEPITRLGTLVKKGEITTMHDALASRLPLREPEIVDTLLPDMGDEVLDVNMVQRMTDSGRRVRFSITAVVGNGDGFVGLGTTKGKEVGPSIRKAIDNAKLNIIEIKRGCGSWECGCGTPHSLPFAVKGKNGSTCVVLKPAPKGITLAAGDVAKQIVRLAGIRDMWGSTKGQSRTTINYAKATFDALKETARTRITKAQAMNLHIHTGATGVCYIDFEAEAAAKQAARMKRSGRRGGPGRGGPGGPGRGGPGGPPRGGPGGPPRGGPGGPPGSGPGGPPRSGPGGPPGSGPGGPPRSGTSGPPKSGTSGPPKTGGTGGDKK